MILVIRKIFIIKVQPRYNYIKFWAVILIIRSFLGSPFLIPSSIAAILSVLYILDVTNYELLYKKGSESKQQIVNQ
jgi:hypothetical protein